jgi:hypothetical protein
LNTRLSTIDLVQNTDGDLAMAMFILKVLNTKNIPTATLTIVAEKGTDKDGFGWEWLGRGLNTGGKWDWLWLEDANSGITGFSIILKDKDDQIFGFVDADWEKVSNPNGYPPQPWFSQTGFNSGTVTVVILVASGQSSNWKLK